MRGRSHFGPGAYVVRYAWWGPVIPAALGAAIIAGFVVATTGVAGLSARPHPGPGSRLGPWAGRCTARSG
jgi:hypothetical protein